MKRSDLEIWSRAAGKKPAREQDKKPVALRIRDLPGIRKLEDHLLLFSDDPHRIDDEVAEVSRQLFAIEPKEVRHDLPDEFWDLPDYSDERYRITVAHAKHENQFATSDRLSPERTVEVLATLGVDFLDDQGQPLRCTKRLGRVAEAAARGLKGKLPDRGVANLHQWEESMKKAVDAFMARKRK
jgi:hypothetical protein